MQTSKRLRPKTVVFVVVFGGEVGEVGVQIVQVGVETVVVTL